MVRPGSEIIRDRLGIERRGHDEHLAGFGPAGLLKLLHESQRHVAEQIALVEFVEDDDADVGQGAVVLEPAEQYALGHEANPRSQAGLIIEADLIAHLVAELCICVPQATRAATVQGGRDAARLQNDNFFITCQAGIEEHLGDLRRFARAGGRDEHEAIAGLKLTDDGIVNLPDGKGS